MLKIVETNLDEAEYQEGIRRACLGEIAGAAFVEAFDRGNYPEEQREALRLMSQLEHLTGRIVGTLLSQPVTREERQEAIARGRQAVGRFDSWKELLIYLSELGSYVDEFEVLRDAAGPMSRPALELLVGHEQALIDFARCALAESGDSSMALRGAVSAAEAYLAMDVGQGHPGPLG